jgi:hypothetical protein
MSQFGLLKNKGDACMYSHRAEGYSSHQQIEAEAVTVARAMKDHADRRMEYVAVVNERSSLLSIIEGLEAEMAGLMMGDDDEQE